MKIFVFVDVSYDMNKDGDRYNPSHYPMVVAQTLMQAAEIFAERKYGGVIEKISSDQYHRPYVYISHRELSNYTGRMVKFTKEVAVFEYDAVSGAYYSGN